MNGDFVVIVGQSYLCNFKDWDRYRLLENSLDTKGGMLGLESGYSVSLKLKNAALFRTRNEASLAIKKFKLDRTTIIEYSSAPIEL
jgi:hypothetical protein